MVDVVAAASLEVVERAKRADIGGARRAEARSIVMISETGAAHGFDIAQGIGTDRRIASDGAGRHVDRDARRSREVSGINDDVVAAAAVDEIIATTSFECLERAGSVVASEQYIVVVRTPDIQNVADRIVADIGNVA